MSGRRYGRHGSTAIIALAFLGGSFLGGVGYAFIKIRLLQRFDAKFDGAPGVALELDLLGGLALSLLGAAVLFVAATLTSGLPAKKTTLALIVIGAVFYVPIVDQGGTRLPGLLSSAGGSAALTWALLAFYPVVLYSVARRTGHTAKWEG